MKAQANKPLKQGKGVSFPEYKIADGNCITKDGHTMFISDVVKDLNRKSHLERRVIKMQKQLAEKDVVISELKSTLKSILNSNNRSDYVFEMHTQIEDLIND